MLPWPPVRAPPHTIPAPPFPRELPWVNVAPLRMDKQIGRPVKWTDERRLALWEPYHRLRAKGLSMMEASRELSRSLEVGHKSVAKRIKEARGLGPGMLEATLGPMTLAAEGKVTVVFRESVIAHMDTCQDSALQRGNLSAYVD